MYCQGKLDKQDSWDRTGGQLPQRPQTFPGFKMFSLRQESHYLSSSLSLCLFRCLSLPNHSLIVKTSSSLFRSVCLYISFFLFLCLYLSFSITHFHKDVLTKIAQDPLSLSLSLSLSLPPSLYPKSKCRFQRKWFLQCRGAARGGGRVGGVTPLQQT